MATVGDCHGNSFSHFTPQNSILTSPEKIRSLLEEGVSSKENRNISEQANAEDLQRNTQAPSDATSRDGFFSRVETYSCMKWAGKPPCLSPLMCARYGWTNVSCDMLKCCSCQAFLCASLQPTADLTKYNSRVDELTKQLQSQHERFCPWPDCPSPERLWLVSACEPSALLTSFLERYESACRLAQQLPAMKPDQLKSLSLTENIISDLLQMLDKELKERNRAQGEVPLDVQVVACIVSIFGWSASLTQRSSKLPVLSCSHCMRKVGLWNFHQMELMGGDGEASAKPDATVAQAAGIVSVPAEVQGDAPASASPSCRMKLRSQDSTRPDPGETASLSPLTRGKRPATRSRSIGDDQGTLHTSKRICLSSFDSPDCHLLKEVFNPISQHRDWCPWISLEKENLDPNAASGEEGESPAHQRGWKAVLNLLMPVSSAGATQVQGPRDKSKKVFAIFQQWQVSSETK